MKSLFLLILLIPFFAEGQQTDLHALVSQGDFNKSKDMSVSWTLGEPFTETVSLGNNVITQGFQQPNIEIIRLPPSDDKIMEASLFPNPTQGWLKLKIAEVIERYRVEIIDITGRILSDTWYDEPEAMLDLSGFPTGQYIIRVADTVSDTQATFSVIKF